VEVSGTNVARVFFHYTDPNNAYFIELDTTAAAVKLIEIVNGATSAITTGSYTSGASVPVKIKVYNDAGAQRIKIWVNGTLRINTTDASHTSGGVAFGDDAAPDTRPRRPAVDGEPVHDAGHPRHSRRPGGFAGPDPRGARGGSRRADARDWERGRTTPMRGGRGAPKV
jgi:hypothetical protein